MSTCTASLRMTPYAMLQEDVRDTLQKFEGLLENLGQLLHTSEETGLNRGLAGTETVAKPSPAAADGSMPATKGVFEAPGSMSQPRPQRAAAGDDDPRTPYSGIHSIRDSTGGWRWIVSAAEAEGKAQSFPLDAGKSAALARYCTMYACL